MNRKVVRSFRVILSEKRRPVSERSLSLGVVQWALNLAYLERLGTSVPLSR